MKNSINTLAAAVAVVLFQSTVLAHGGPTAKLHVNPRWSECSFQLDAALTQNSWRKFTREAGLVVYFRSLTDARPMGAGNYEVSILQWGTGIDENEDAWNDTFVHPDSVHWLIDGDQIPIPGLSFRAGLTENIDVAGYLTKSPGANYGFWGGQVQVAVAGNEEKKWAASARMSFVSMYGPDDIDLTVYGVDLLASKEVAVYSDWVTVSPYAGVSAYLSSSHEKSSVVNLQDERILGVQAMVGAAAQISVAKLSVEYNFATVNTISFKIGVGI